MNDTYQGTFTVINEKGLHTRPSTELVKCAVHFKSQVTLIHDKQCVSAKSLLGILTLAAERGTKIKVKAVGDDAELAVKSIIDLAQHKFNISY